MELEKWQMVKYAHNLGNRLRRMGNLVVMQI